MSGFRKTIAGVPCLFIPLDTNSVTALVLVKAGSLYESQTKRGISHFLEHMFFKGGKKYTTPKAVAQAIEDFGGETNAFTSYDYAGYYIKSAPDYLSQSVDILADMLLSSTFHQEEMEREKGVVIQEIAMYQDEPQEVLADGRRDRYFGDTIRGRNIIGTPDSVSSITRDDLFAHQKSLYTKDNSLVVIAGKISDQTELEAQLHDLFGSMTDTKTVDEPSFFHKKPQQSTHIIEHETQQNHVIYSFPGMNYFDTDKYLSSIIMTAFGGFMSSRLFQRIREQRGLCYYVGGGQSISASNGTFRVRAGLDKSRFDEGTEAIMQEITTLFDEGISEEEFDRARRYTVGQLVMGLEGSDSYAQYFGKKILLYNDDKTLGDIITAYQGCNYNHCTDFFARRKPETVYRCHIQ